MVQDSLDAVPTNKTPGGTAAAPAASRAVWFNSSRCATQDGVPPHAAAAAAGCRGQAAGPDATCAEDVPAAAAEVQADVTAATDPDGGVPASNDSGTADAVLRETHHNVEEGAAVAGPTAGVEQAAVHEEEAAPHDISPCPGKENQEAQTPGTASADGKGSAGNVKRQGGCTDGCATHPVP